MNYECTHNCENRITKLEEFRKDAEPKIDRLDRAYYMVIGGWAVIGIVWAAIQIVLKVYH